PFEVSLAFSGLDFPAIGSADAASEREAENSGPHATPALAALRLLTYLRAPNPAASAAMAPRPGKSMSPAAFAPVSIAETLASVPSAVGSSTPRTRSSVEQEAKRTRIGARMRFFIWCAFPGT